MIPKFSSSIRLKSTYTLAILGTTFVLAAVVNVGARDKLPARKPLADCVQQADKIATEASAWGSLRWVMNASRDPDSPLTVGIAKINPGQSNPLHMHGNCDEVIHVLSGSCEQRVGSETVILKAGDTLRIPAGLPHQAKALGKIPCESIVVYNTGNRQFTPVKEHVE